MLGFILQATYRIQQGVPVVTLFGRLSNGETFTVRDTRQRPHFYVDAASADRIQGARVVPSNKATITGGPVVRVEVDIPGDAPRVREHLHAAGIQTYEADVRFAMRYLIERNIRSGVEIKGAATPGRATQWVYENPELRPAAVTACPRVLSFDIETTPDANKLLAIAFYGLGVDEVVVVDPGVRVMPERAVGVRTEKDALDYFVRLVERLDVDVLTGWNVVDFDLSVLATIASRLRYDMKLGRDGGHMRIRPAEGYFGSGSATIPGRIVLDGIDLVRGAFIRLDDYSLDGVSQVVLGEGKTLGGDGEDKVAQILDTYAHDLPRFTQYARTDARLALQIIEKLDLVKLAFARAALTGMTPDRVAASIASFDFLYLAQLHRLNLCAPSVVARGGDRVAQGGGVVFEPLAGVHENVWVCDFKSLYPSIIRTFNIDPLSFARGQQGAESIETHDGTRFASVPGILPDMLETLFPQRAKAKARGDEVASQAIKILMNSFYGVLGTPQCRFFSPEIVNAITSQGRHLLGWSRDWFTGRGYSVLYGDTDSLFVASGTTDEVQADRTITKLVKTFNAELAAYILDRHGVTSYLELEFEKLYTRLFLATTRGGGQGARKRYAGIRAGDDEVEFVGMEVVRRDWTDLAKEVQRELFKRLFHGDKVVEYLGHKVADVRSGACDTQLVYRKGLRKSVDSYTTHVPPHVQAVKKSSAPPPRVVRYIVTEQGPELESELMHPPDREHYVQKQIRPVAEPVLEALGLVFAQVIGDDRQISLF